MVCIHCGSKTQVSNSRLQKRSNQVWRRRQCSECKAIFTTEESVQYGAVWAVQSKNNVLKPFSRDKLFMSMYKSCGHRQTALEDAGGLTDTVIKKLAPLSQDGRIWTSTIVQVAQVTLNRFDKAASVYYQSRHR